ncbi:MAG: type II toxin-antitoxin system RelE/ParE family toxin [Bacteroidetes bacterium]|nr:type II toxin-antitoxin system RelE/ParE family toxin [Bacteroidota bacterium]
MARVHFTEQAQSELGAIIEDYERIGADDFAEAFEEKVIEKIRPLEQFPRMGRIVREIGDEAIRDLLMALVASVWFVRGVHLQDHGARGGRLHFRAALRAARLARHVCTRT